MMMPPPGGQTTVGMTPTSASDVNMAVGSLLRQFTEVKARVEHFEGWLATIDLKVQPYSMSANDETLIKSAIADLNTSLAAVNMAFINRLTGLW